MKYFRMLALFAVTLSFLLFASGCMDFWAGEALRYAKTGELYDDRDYDIVRRPFELGRSFLVVEVDLTYFGDEYNPNADIRHDLSFQIVPPNSFDYISNFYEDESWDFYDAIDPTFVVGDSNIGSVFFEIPDISVYDYIFKIFASENIENATTHYTLLEKKVGEMEHVSGYPEYW